MLSLVIASSANVASFQKTKNIGSSLWLSAFVDTTLDAHTTSEIVGSRISRIEINQYSL